MFESFALQNRRQRRLDTVEKIKVIWKPRTYGKSLIMLLIKKRKEDRTESEQAWISSYLKRFQFFEDLSTKTTRHVYNEIWNCLRLRKHPGNGCIIQSGDMCTKLFFLMKGTVAVIIPKAEDNSEIEQDDKQTRKIPKIKVLKPGQYFGEESLVKEKPINASYFWHSVCYFLTLELKDYRDIWEMYDCDKLNKTVDILNQIPMLQVLANNSLLNFSQFCKVVKFNKDHIVYREKEEANEIYISVKGEFSFFKRLNVPAAYDDFYEWRSRSNSRDKDLFYNPNRHTWTGKSESKHTHHIFNLDPNQVFGHVDWFYDQPRMLTCKATSVKNKLLVIRKRDFFKFIKGTEAQTIFDKGVKTQHAWILERIEEIRTTLDEQKPSPPPAKTFDKRHRRCSSMNYPYHVETSEYISAQSTPEPPSIRKKSCIIYRNLNAQTFNYTPCPYVKSEPVSHQASKNIIHNRISRLDKAQLMNDKVRELLATKNSRKRSKSKRLQMLSFSKHNMFRRRKMVEFKI